MSGFELAGIVLGAFPVILEAISKPANFFRSIREAIKDLRAGTDDQWTLFAHDSIGSQIRVWDVAVPVSTLISPKIIAACRQNNDNELLQLEGLASQPNGTIRIYVWEHHLLPPSDFNKPCYDQLSFPSIDKHTYTTSFMSLLSRSRKHAAERWHRFEAYHMINAKESKFGDVEYARVERNLIYKQEENEKTQVMIFCRTYVPERMSDIPLSEVSTLTSSFISCLRELNSGYRSIGDMNNRRDVFTLQYIHTNLIMYAEFLLDYEERYRRNRQHLFDPRRSKFKPEHLKLITRQSSRIQEMGQISGRLRQAAEATIAIVKETLATDKESRQPSAQDAQPFQLLESEIRGHCEEIRGCITRLSTSLEHDLKFLGLNRDMEQADSVQQLTILATIFLPLSLAAAVLSMQTRFKDLGVLIYDFIGITVLLGALVVPFILFLSMLKFATGSLMVRLEMRMAERVDSKSHDYLFLKKITRYMVAPGMVLWGALILASFLIGMFKTVKLGCMILGYGTAGMIGVIVIVSPIPFINHFLLGLLLGDRREPQEIPR